MFVLKNEMWLFDHSSMVHFLTFIFIIMQREVCMSDVCDLTFLYLIAPSHNYLVAPVSVIFTKS